MIIPLYLSCLFLLLSASLWNALLSSPWDGLIIGLIVATYAFSWVLPAVSYPLARRLEGGHHRLDIILLRVGGPGILVIAGILGASVGLHSGSEAVWIMSLLAPLLAVGWAQYAAAVLWPSRPWAQEEEP